MYFLLFFSTILYVLGLIAERRINDRCLASFDMVIHVNGIRGKTSTCRMLDAALRQRYRVFTKTTGTFPCIIGTDGRERPLRRLGPAHIGEQLRVIRQAHREGAEILILECMAVKPELQKICQEKIVKSRISVITNVRYDHCFEMGQTLPEIAASLGEAIPRQGTLYTTAYEHEALYRQLCVARDSQLVLADDPEALALAVCTGLGITEQEFWMSRSQVIRDFGASHLYSLSGDHGQNLFFLNLFSVNDPQSTRLNLDPVAPSFSRVCFLYNHRQDRPDRALLFARYFFPAYPQSTVFLMGDTPALTRRIFHRNNPGLDLRPISNWKICLQQSEGTLLVGIGNIRGSASKIVQFLEKGEVNHE